MGTPVYRAGTIDDSYRPREIRRSLAAVNDSWFELLELKWRRPELVSENGQFLLWKQTVFTLEKKLEVLKELDKGLSQRLVGER